MSRNWALALRTWIVVACVTQAQSAELSIRHAEPLRITLDGTRAGSQKLTSGSSELKITAYGRQFDLQLQSNAEILGRLPTAQRARLNARHSLYRGQIAGIAGSWTRITRVGDEYFGAIWDGTDLYALAPARAVTPYLRSTSSTAGNTFIYRLADSDSGIENASCVVMQHDGEANKMQLGQFQALTKELRALSTKLNLHGQLEIDLVGDVQFQNANASDPEGAMLARLNIVDGIFSSQLGIQLTARTFNLVDFLDERFNTNEPGKLLGNLGMYRSLGGANNGGITHLLTGKDLQGDIIGMAYRNVLCDARFGVSLSEGQHDTFTSALIMAHELAHNFGAPHDGAPGEACSAAPSGYLMWPYMNGSASLSACSVEQTQAPIQAASCILPPNLPDVSISNTVSEVQAVKDRAYEFPVRIDSIGNASARDVQVNIYVGGLTSVESVSAGGAACSVSGPAITCSFGTLAAGESRQVFVRAIGHSSSSTATASVGASNDVDETNNNRNITFNYSTASDVSLRAGSLEFQGLTRTPLDVPITVASSGVESAENVTVHLDVADLTVLSATVGATECSINLGLVDCQMGSIAPDSTRQIDLRVLGMRESFVSVAAVVSATNDGYDYNNIARFYVRLAPARKLQLTMTTPLAGHLRGESFEAQLEVSSAGSQAIPAALIHVRSSAGIVLDSVTPSQGMCEVAVDHLVCDLGAMDAGTSRTIRILAHGEQLLSNAQIWAVADLDVVDSYEPARGVVVVDVRRAVDVGFANDWSQSTAIDGQPFRAALAVESTGLAAAENVVVTLPIPDAVTIQRAWINSTDCPLDGRTVICNIGSLAPDASVYVNLTLLAPDPVSFTTTATLTADADDDPSDNVATLSIVVNPDIRFDLIPPQTPDRTVVDVAFELTYAVATNRHTPTGASFELSINDSIVVESAQPGTGSCGPVVNRVLKCQLDPLPVDGITPIVVRLRPMLPGTMYISTYLRTEPFRSTTGNNSHYMNLTAQRWGDAAVSFYEQAISGVTGQSLGFTVILEIAETIDDAQLSIGVDTSKVSLRRAELRNGSGFCSTLADGASCYLSTLNTGGRRLIDVYLNAVSSGTSSVTARLTSSGDANQANNTVTLPVTLTDPPPPPPPSPPTPPPPSSGGGGSGNGSGGGGGGGGEFGPLLLALSALLLGHRTRRQIAKRIIRELPGRSDLTRAGSDSLPATGHPGTDATFRQPRVLQGRWLRSPPLRECC